MSLPISSQLEKEISIPLEDDLKSEINHFASEKHFSVGTTVIRQGNYLSTLYFILKGLVRGYYLDENGRERTKCFSKEKEFAGMESLLGIRKASFSVECLEEVDCIALPYRIFSSSPKIRKQFYLILENTLKTKIIDLEQHYQNLLMLDAEGRYRMFLKQYAFLEHRIQQKYIASYLGIEPSSLCRIKRKIKQA